MKPSRSFCAVLVFALGLHAASLQQQLQPRPPAPPGRGALPPHARATGAVVARDPDRPVPTASVIKLGLLLEAMAQVKAGRLALDTPLELTAGNQVPGSGILHLLTPGLRLNLQDALTLMITLSDNTATNMVIDAVGLAPTNARLRAMGLKNTYFYKKVFQPATGPMPADQPQFGLGKTTAREMAEVMESIHRCDLGERALCLDMITMLRNQQYRAMLPRYLDDGEASDGLSPIADKIGALDAVRNDVALVYTRSGPVVISIFTYDNPDHSWTPDNQAEMLIGRLAQAIVRAWSPAGLARRIADPLGMAAGGARR